MLVKKKELEILHLAVAELQKQYNELEKKFNILQGMLHDQELRMDSMDMKTPKVMTSDLVTDEDGMYNFQKYKQHRKARLNGEGEQ